MQFLLLLIHLVAASCELDDAEIYCGMETMSIRVPSCAIQQYGAVDMAQAHIGPKNGTCGSTGMNLGDLTMFEMRLNDCETQMAMNSTHVIYTNFITIPVTNANAIVTRHSVILMQFGCVWRVDNDDALSADSFHTHEIIRPDNVFVKIDGSVPFIWPRLKNCWAMPEHANGTHQTDHKYYFIDHYCGRADELKYNTLDILESGTGEDAHFAITPFEFNDYPGTGFEIACTISLCYEPFYTCSLPDDFCLSPDKYAGLSDDALFPKKATTTTTPATTTTTIQGTMTQKVISASAVGSLNFKLSSAFLKTSKRRERNEKRKRKGRGADESETGRLMRIVNFGLVQPGHNYTLIIPHK